MEIQRPDAFPYIDTACRGGDIPNLIGKFGPKVNGNRPRPRFSIRAGPIPIRCSARRGAASIQSNARANSRLMPSTHTLSSV